MKNETIRKSNIGIAIFETIFKKIQIKKRHTLISCIIMANRLICVMCFVPKNSFMFNFIKTVAHICLTEYVLSIYCVKGIICDFLETQKSVILRYQRNNHQHFFSGPKYKTSLYEHIPYVWGTN